jgi:hypothetical protein
MPSQPRGKQKTRDLREDFPSKEHALRSPRIQGAVTFDDLDSTVATPHRPSSLLSEVGRGELAWLRSLSALSMGSKAADD